MFTHELRLSLSALTAISRRLVEQPNRPVIFPAGLAAGAERLVWLVHQPDWSDRPNDSRLVVVGSSHASLLADQLADAVDQVQPLGLALILGTSAAAGHFTAICRTHAGDEPLAELILVGTGLARISLTPENAGRGLATLRIGRDEVPEMLSRTGGALGSAALARLRRLRVVVVGCGRSGSLVIESLASLGIAELTLIDPDLLEPHNLGEMAGVLIADVGQPKAEILANTARKAPGASSSVVAAVSDSVLALRSLFAIKPADVIVSCPDSPAARLAATILAAAYLKPLLDIGTGILPSQSGRRMGADVRLVAPGRCLLCIGGLTNVTAAKEAILTGKPHPRTGDFRSERLGSLRSLNTLAVGLGQTLLEQYVSGRIRDSVWLQADVGSDGIPQLRRPTMIPRTDCPICRLTGRGDEGLRDLASILQQL